MSAKEQWLSWRFFQESGLLLPWAELLPKNQEVDNAKLDKKLLDLVVKPKMTHTVEGKSLNRVYFEMPVGKQKFHSK